MQTYKEKGGVCPTMFDPVCVPLSRIPNRQDMSIFDFSDADRPSFGSGPPPIPLEHYIIAARYYINMREYNLYEGPLAGAVFVWIEPDTQAVYKPSSFTNFPGVQCFPRDRPQVDRNAIKELG